MGHSGGGDAAGGADSHLTEDGAAEDSGANTGTWDGLMHGTLRRRRRRVWRGEEVLRQPLSGKHQAALPLPCWAWWCMGQPGGGASTVASALTAGAAAEEEEAPILTCPGGSSSGDRETLHEQSVLMKDTFTISRTFSSFSEFRPQQSVKVRGSCR